MIQEQLPHFLMEVWLANCVVQDAICAKVIGVWPSCSFASPDDGMTFKHINMHVTCRLLTISLDTYDLRVSPTETLHMAPDADLS